MQSSPSRPQGDGSEPGRSEARRRGAGALFFGPGLRLLRRWIARMETLETFSCKYR